MKDIISALRKEFGEEIYIVGGAVRDHFLRRTIKDVDFILREKKRLEKKLRTVARREGFSFFPLRKEKIFRMTRKKNRSLQMDFSLFKETRLEENLRKRDFTVNSAACRAGGVRLRATASGFRISGMGAKRVIDPFGALRDLRRKKIRFVSGQSSILDDPLRMLRAFRFSAQLGFSLDERAGKLIKKNSAQIIRSSPERIREELTLILENRDCARFLRETAKAGLLFAVFPELKAQENCARTYYGNGGVLSHTFKVVERMDFLCENAPRIIPSFAKIKKYFEKKYLLKIICLLHDAAKPEKASMINGRLRFFGHEQFGATMAEAAMKRLHFSGEDIKAAKAAIGSHLRPGNLASNNFISDKAVFRLFRDMGDNLVHLLLLCWADHSSYISKKSLDKILPDLSRAPLPVPPKGFSKTGIRKTTRFLQVLGKIFGFYTEKGKIMKSKNLVNGREVMKITGLPEGPEIGRILEKIRSLHFENKIRTKKEAIAYLKKLPKPERRAAKTA